MVKVGDVCPLFFNPIKDGFGPEADYIQKFHSSDKILLQIFSTEEVPSAELNRLSAGDTSAISFDTYSQNENTTMYYATLTGLDDGIYSVTVGEETSEEFEVSSSDVLLEETSLIRYSHNSNNSAFDNIFWMGEEQQVFEFRAEAGFKPVGYSPQVDNEQYRNQMQEAVDLYAVPYDIYQLTMGNAVGVPYWFARHLNRICCLSMVEIGGVRYVRSESNVPELTQAIEDGQLFQVNMLLERQENDIAGIGGRPETGTSYTGVSFEVEGAKDGQMLQYQEEKNAFVNVTTVEV